MEELKQTEMNFIENNFNEFKSSLQILIPAIFDLESNNTNIKIYEHFGEVRVYLTRQSMAEDLTDSLAVKMNLNILYAQKTIDGKVYNIVGFSNIEQNKMYIIEIPSNMYGVVEYMNVIFYDSIEIMYQAIMDKYKEFSKGNKKHIVMENMDSRQIWNIFKI